MKRTALIVVDVQNDFLPGGALGVEDGHKATPLLWRLMDEVDIIVFTRDWHPEDHMSFFERGLPNRMVNNAIEAGLWPPHCIQDTEGAEIDEWLWEKAIETGKPILLVNKSYEQDKEVYSGFGGVVAAVVDHPDDPNRIDLDERIDLIGKNLATALQALNVGSVKIGGLALDYCVKATAVDARKNDLFTTVYLNATRPVTYLGGVSAVDELNHKGVFLDTREV